MGDITKLRTWALGAFGAAVNSGVGGITLMIVSPRQFNVFAGAEVTALLKVCVALALVGFALYVKEHPVEL
jgi:hypothetical protein